LFKTLFQAFEHKNDRVPTIKEGYMSDRDEALANAIELLMMIRKGSVLPLKSLPNGLP
jgi:hypothetical protein